MEKEFDILTGAKRLDEVRFSKIRTVMDMVADLRAKGEKVLALSAGEPDFDTPAPIKEAVIKAFGRKLYPLWLQQRLSGS